MIAGISISTEALWAGGAIIIAAAIAALGVHLQTARTLNAERERLDDQLRAERERLAMQLAHDRATQERSELRRVLDEAATRMDELAFTAIEAITAARQAFPDEEAGDLPELSKDQIEQAIGDELDRMFAVIRSVDGHKSRIGMRLGEKHPARVHYGEARDCFGQLHQRLLAFDFEEEEAIRTAIREAGTKAGEFERAAFALTKSQLD